MLSFYQKDFGLGLSHKSKDRAGLEVVELGFGRQKNGQLVILRHDPNAVRIPNSAGLYHFAIRVPDRKSLASTFVGLGNSGVYFDGFADHLVSEALYLSDPDGNGIEIYRDRPKQEWKFDDDGNILQATGRLDLDSLLSELSQQERQSAKPFPTGAEIGHMHLKVTNLERSVKFYHEMLGLDITWNLSKMGASFLSAGGYHHHIGLNTWESLGGPPHRDGDAGLENFRIKVPNQSILKGLASHVAGSPSEKNQVTISDPDKIRIVIESR
jgi:catechol 2,3-dioxygenase